MRIVLMSFVSIDGVYQGPGAPDEDRTGEFARGGWLVPFADSTFEAKVAEWMATATGFLFGRRTYEAFSRVWPSINDPADQNAERLNTLPKFVVATNGVDLSWGPATAVTDDVLTHLTSLRQGEDGELQVHGSGRLARWLLSMGLVDELRLVTAPVIVGQGRRLFGTTPASIGLELLWQDRTPSGLLMSQFACADEAAVGTYVRGETDVAMRSPRGD